MRAGDTYVCTATALSLDGRGVAHQGGCELRVADLLPQERAQVIIEHVSPHRRLAWARVVHRVGDSAEERVSAICPRFGHCGGCVWQHVAYSAQLEQKRRFVASALGGQLDVPAVVSSPRQAGYRNYGKYVVGASKHNLILVGAYAPRSHTLISTLGCRIVEPVINEVAAALSIYVDPVRLRPYDEVTRCGDLRYVLVRSNAAGRALVGIVTTRGANVRSVDALADRLTRAIPAICGVVHVINDATTGVLMGEVTRTVWGDSVLHDQLGPVPTRVTIGAFAQVNREQSAALYAAVADAAGHGTLLDVYCGAGGISLTAALRGRRVIGIERHAPSVASAQWSARSAGVADRAQFRVGSAQTLAADAARADVIVVNPPRKGLDKATRAALTACAPRKLIYVSCNPYTLARDIDALTGLGLTRIQPFDLMPGTGHVETLAVLES